MRDRKLVSRVVGPSRTEAEVSVFLGSHAALVDAAGRRRVVRSRISFRNASSRRDRPSERAPTPCAGTGGTAPSASRPILPRLSAIAPRAPSFCQPVSEGHFHLRLRGSLAALLGSSARGFRLLTTIDADKEVWGVEADSLATARLTAKRYVYFWVDGIYFSARMEEEKQCILVIVGATDKGQKALLSPSPTAMRK